MTCSITIGKIIHWYFILILHTSHVHKWLQQVCKAEPGIETIWLHNHTPSLDAFVQDDCIQEGVEVGPQQLQFHQTWGRKIGKGRGSEPWVGRNYIHQLVELVPTFA